MKKTLNYSTIAFILISLLVLSQESKAQLRDYNFKLGLQANYLLQATEFEDDGISYLIRPFGRYEISKYFQLEGGIGFGTLQGADYGNGTYKTSIIPLDLRLLVAPLEFESWNPYLYLGVGANIWSLSENPTTPPVSPTAETDGFEGMALLGLGVEIALNPNWTLGIDLGFTVVDSDNLNGLATDLNDEFLHEYDRYYNIGVSAAYAFGGCNTDEDNDGLTKCEEDEMGLDPNNPDTDGDGLSDGDELQKYNTDPKRMDSDGDGLNDKSEVMTYKTNPNKADTDNDGLNDGAEVNTHKTDPTIADTDGDGLNDGDEVNKYKTNPNKKDTDGDGLSDGDEVNVHKTDPNNSDSDSDMLTDGEEVMKIKSNPLEADTDKGGVNDGVEIKNSTNPLDASDDAMAEMKKMPKDKAGAVVEKFEPVLFALDSYKIRNSQDALLKKVLSYLIDNPNVELMINGHTDNQGPEVYNKKLSINRADAVKNWLVKKGVKAGRLHTKGFGLTKPVADNTTEAGRQKNRRAELIVKGSK